MNIRQQYNRQISFYFIIGLLLHIPAFAYIAYPKNELMLAIGVSLFLLAGPVVMYMMGISSTILPSVISFTTIGFSGLLIHLNDGMIEMHFHIFIVLATFIAFGLLTPVVVGVLTAAVHHVSFYFLLPDSIFNYQASLGIVSLHAFFVVLEAIPVAFITFRFQKLIDMQDTTLSKLNHISNQIVGSVGVINQSGQQLSDSSLRDSESLQETAASLEEISSMVQLNTKNAEQAAKLSTVSSEEAFQGNDQVQKLIQSISEISQDSKKMEEIIVVIDDIAFQTNLLALNAAVEASRAGEHGRGFAVVAEAVRTLAQRSSSSAKDINALIAESVRKVKQGSILAEQSGKVLESIVSNVKKVSELNESIATGSGEQSIAISQINQAMSQLDKSSRQNSEASQKVAEMAQDLNGRSSDMNSLIIQLGKEIGVGKAS